MLNFLKGPEERLPPTDLDGSGPLSEWTINMTDQVYNPAIIKYETEIIPWCFPVDHMFLNLKKIYFPFFMHNLPYSLFAISHKEIK